MPVGFQEFLVVVILSGRNIITRFSYSLEQISQLGNNGQTRVGLGYGIGTVYPVYGRKELPSFPTPNTSNKVGALINMPFST